MTTTYLISMFNAVLLQRYAGSSIGVIALGQPIPGPLFHGIPESSVPFSEDMPLVMNSRRGSLDLSSKGAKQRVRICVPVTLTS
jgi:hypothetical protein